MHKLKAVIFDLDGVLTETSLAHFQAWQQLAKRLGFALHEDAMDAVRGISRMDSLDIVLAYGGMEKRFTTDEKRKLADLKNEDYLDIIKGYTPAELAPGAKSLLDALKSHNIGIALASASASGPFLLKALGIDSYFDAIVDPKTVPRGKPAPDIFSMACEALGFLPKMCIGVEDAVAGIEAIMAAGMVPIGIGDKKRLSMCEDVFETLDVFHTYLRAHDFFQSS